MPLWVSSVSACPCASPSSTRSGPPDSLRATTPAPCVECVTPKTPCTLPAVSVISPRIAAAPATSGASVRVSRARPVAAETPLVAAAALVAGAGTCSSATRHLSSSSSAPRTSSAEGAPGALKRSGADQESIASSSPRSAATTQAYSRPGPRQRSRAGVQESAAPSIRSVKYGSALPSAPISKSARRVARRAGDRAPGEARAARGDLDRPLRGAGRNRQCAAVGPGRAAREHQQKESGDARKGLRHKGTSPARRSLRAIHPEAHCDLEHGRDAAWKPLERRIRAHATPRTGQAQDGRARRRSDRAELRAPTSSSRAARRSGRRRFPDRRAPPDRAAGGSTLAGAAGPRRSLGGHDARHTACAPSVFYSTKFTRRRPKS